MIIPECFKNFKCINKDCTDNCCIGWEIDIDKNTKEFYKNYNGELKERFQNSVSYGEVCHFIMNEDGRCPFLRSDNLCEIILKLGEEKTPYICRNHPRFYTWLYDRTECGIGLACEEGARLLFEKEDKFKVNFNYKLTDNISDILTYARETAFYILNNRTIPLRERLMQFLEYSSHIDECLFDGNNKEIISLSDRYKNQEFTVKNNCDDISKKDLRTFLSIFKDLDPIDSEWETYIKSLYENSDEILKRKNETEEYKYEHLACYFVYRYFLKATEDNDILSKAKLTVISVVFNVIMDIFDLISGKKADRIYNAKLYSKEVEYSEENLNYIFDKTYEDEILSLDGLFKLLKILK